MLNFCRESVLESSPSYVRFFLEQEKVDPAEFLRENGTRKFKVSLPDAILLRKRGQL